MKLRFFFILSILSYTVHLFGQLQQACVTIGGAGDDRGSGIIQATDGGYAITGYTTSYGSGAKDVYMIKVDGSFNLQWTRTVGSAANEWGRSIIQTLDGGYAVAGHLDFNIYSGYLAKLDASGAYQWSKYTPPAGQTVEFMDVIQNTDGSYTMAGITNDWQLPHFGDAYIITYNSTGTAVVSSSIIGISGGSFYTQAGAIKSNGNGGYVIGGWTSDFGAGGYDFYFASYTSGGTLDWSRRVGGGANEFAYSMCKSSDGGYVLVGQTASYGQGGTDVYAVKINSAGTLQWTRTVGGTANENGTGIVQASDGGYVIAGVSNSFGAGNNDVYLVKLDSNGGLLWTRTLGSTGDDGAGYEGNNIANSSSGGYVISGQSNSYGSGYQVYLLKVDSDGNGCCNSGSGGVASSGGNTGSGGSVFSGSSLSSSGSGNSGGTLTQQCILLPIELLSFTGNCENKNVKLTWQTASEQNNDYFTIEKGTRDSEIQWKEIGTVKGAGNSSTVKNYEFTDAELPTTTAYYRLKQVDFDGKSETYGPISVKCESNDNWDLLLQSTPATDELLGTLFLPEDVTYKVEILDLQGRIISLPFGEGRGGAKGSNLLKFDVKNISSGVYFINVHSNEKQIVKKFIKL